MSTGNELGTLGETPLRLTVAALIGLAVGLEREWSGHASGPHARFAGLRTFFLLGLLGGIAGLFIQYQHDAAGVALLVTAGALSVAAYVSAVRREAADLDGTTEVAALVVLALGAFTMLGSIVVAAGAAAVVVLLLGEKARLHWLVGRIAPEELEAALQFAVLALVVLPLLPAGPFGGILDIRPQGVWAVVLLFSGLNFAGYVARRVVGAERGYGVTGLLGGVVSSTAVTLQFSRQSRSDPELSTALSRGVIGACTVLIPRILLLSAIINADVAVALFPRVMIPLGIGVGLYLLAPHDGGNGDVRPHTNHENPLGLAASIRMAVAFQAAMSVIALVGSVWGTTGVYTTAGALGLTDVDALTASMSRHTAVIGAQAIAIGAVANTGLKLAVSLVFGAPQFRRHAGAGLLALLVGHVIGVWLWWRP